MGWWVGWWGFFVDGVLLCPLSISTLEYEGHVLTRFHVDVRG